MKMLINFKYEDINYGIHFLYLYNYVVNREDI